MSQLTVPAFYKAILTGAKALGNTPLVDWLEAKGEWLQSRGGPFADAVFAVQRAKSIEITDPDQLTEHSYMLWTRPRGSRDWMIERSVGGRYLSGVWGDVDHSTIAVFANGAKPPKRETNLTLFPGGKPIGRGSRQIEVIAEPSSSNTEAGNRMRHAIKFVTASLQTLERANIKPGLVYYVGKYMRMDDSMAQPSYVQFKQGREGVMPLLTVTSMPGDRSRAPTSRTFRGSIFDSEYISDIARNAKTDQGGMDHFPNVKEKVVVPDGPALQHPKVVKIPRSRKKWIVLNEEPSTFVNLVALSGTDKGSSASLHTNEITEVLPEIPKWTGTHARRRYGKYSERRRMSGHQALPFMGEAPGKSPPERPLAPPKSTFTKGHFPAKPGGFTMVSTKADARNSYTEAERHEALKDIYRYQHEIGQDWRKSLGLPQRPTSSEIDEVAKRFLEWRKGISYEIAIGPSPSGRFYIASLEYDTTNQGGMGSYKPKGRVLRWTESTGPALKAMGGYTTHALLSDMHHRYKRNNYNIYLVLTTKHYTQGSGGMYDYEPVAKATYDFSAEVIGEQNMTSRGSKDKLIKALRVHGWTLGKQGEYEAIVSPQGTARVILKARNARLQTVDKYGNWGSQSESMGSIKSLANNLDQYVTLFNKIASKVKVAPPPAITSQAARKLAERLNSDMSGYKGQYKAFAIGYTAAKAGSPRSGGQDERAGWDAFMEIEANAPTTKVKVSLNQRGKWDSIWHNIQAYQDGKWVTYGYSPKKKRWARNTRPPQWVRDELIEMGHGAVFGLT